MSEKASFAIKRAIGEFGLEEDYVFELLSREEDDSSLNPTEQEDRRYFAALIANLIDFSVAQEYQMLEEIIEVAKATGDYDLFEEEALMYSKRYNKLYTRVEQSDLVQAVAIAEVWRGIDGDEIIEYRTQRDERVRDLHRSFDGLRYRKRDFPPALVPPIEHGCRCFITNTGTTDGRKLTNRAGVTALINKIANPTFRENFAETGVMFSEEHPYFDVAEEHLEELKKVSERIKKKYNL